MKSVQIMQESWCFFNKAVATFTHRHYQDAIRLDDIDSRIQKATKASISSSKSEEKKARWGKKKDKSAIMQQQVRLLILRLIKKIEVFFLKYNTVLG